MKTIMVSTDFSASSNAACKYAAKMAEAMNAQLFILHVCEFPEKSRDLNTQIVHSTQVTNACLQLSATVHKQHVHTGRKLNILSDVRTGNFIEELKTACEKIKPYSLVMGTRGTNLYSTLNYGSNTVYCLKNLDWPIIAVPEDAEFSSIKKIGLACDMNQIINEVPVEELKNMLNGMDANVHIFNTAQKGGYNPELVFESGLLHQILSPLNITYHLVASNDNDEKIFAYTKKNNFNLLILMPKHENMIDILSGSRNVEQLTVMSYIPFISLPSQKIAV